MRGCPGLISPSCYLPFDSLRWPQMTIRDGDAEKVTCPRTDSSPSYTQGPRSTSWLNQEKRATKIELRWPSRQLLQKTMHTTRPAVWNKLQVVAPRWLGIVDVGRDWRHATEENGRIDMSKSTAGNCNLHVVYSSREESESVDHVLPYSVHLPSLIISTNLEAQRITVNCHPLTAAVG
jgi:hypothetical protein